MMEFTDLISRFLDDELDDAAELRLARLVTENEAARRYLRSMIALDAELRARAAGGDVTATVLRDVRALKERGAGQLGLGS